MRKALEPWLKEREDKPGLIFITPSGHRLGHKQFFKAVKRVERQANAHLTAKERVTVSPHVLRHLFLRKLTETKGIQYAKGASGHKTDWDSYLRH